jgi:hypothetical protein
MAVLWSEDSTVGRWLASPLHGRHCDLRRVEAADDLRTESVVRLVRSAEPDDQWVLLSATDSGVRVNGAPLTLGIRVLRHRDEIVLPAASEGPRRWFYSGECVVEVRPLPRQYEPATCPRCKRRIAVGTPAVQCPNSSCGAWYHQTDESPCWSSGEYCGLCETPAVLDAGTRWSPEDL